MLHHALWTILPRYPNEYFHLTFDILLDAALGFSHWGNYSFDPAPFKGL